MQDGKAPRLMLPSSRKGRKRRIERRPVPVSAVLAHALLKAAAARGAGATDLLFVAENGMPCTAHWEGARFGEQLMKRINLKGVTAYALRHSSIVRMILAGVPIRVVAAQHDTSVRMIEKNYSRFISDPADAMARRAMLDFSAPAIGNVVALPRGSDNR